MQAVWHAWTFGSLTGKSLHAERKVVRVDLGSIKRLYNWNGLWVSLTNCDQVCSVHKNLKES